MTPHRWVITVPVFRRGFVAKPERRIVSRHKTVTAAQQALKWHGPGARVERLPKDLR